MKKRGRGWGTKRNDEQESLFWKENIASIIRNRTLQWAGHALRSRNQLTRLVMDENPFEKIPN